jgi:hypothetical protein
MNSLFVERLARKLCVCLVYEYTHQVYLQLNEANNNSRHSKWSRNAGFSHLERKFVNEKLCDSVTADNLFTSEIISSLSIPGTYFEPTKPSARAVMFQ